MKARAAVSRIAKMDREELRFRLTGEARRLAGQIRFAVRPPQWNRATILRILDPNAGPLVARAHAAASGGDYLAAHRALAEHFQSRASRWPLQARMRGRLSAEIRERFPAAEAAARQRANCIVDGRHDLLGYRGIALGNPPDWHADRVHGRTPPLLHWAAVPYLDAASGDHKIIWETNRHQYFLTLGSAYWLTGNEDYRRTFIAHLQDWLRVNPPLAGVNWASMLELAFRSFSWTWALEFFCGDADQDTTPWIVDLLIALDRQLTHVAHNLSSYFSPNTHLTGEALALYTVSLALPELRRSGRRVSCGRDVLLREAKNQVHADGGHVELSTHYHHYTTDFYLHATMVARAAHDDAATPFAATALKLAAYLRTIADDQGRLPLVGDDDGGQFFKFAGADPADASVTLEVAASLLADDALSTGSSSQEVWWILGRAPASAPHAVTQPPSRVLSDSGYLVSRSADGYLLFDAGPHGFRNGGHAHSDGLSVVLTVGLDPLLVDPGTGTYTMDPEARDRFRSSRMHNTLILDGVDRATPQGPFHWQTRSDARFLVARVGPDLDFAVGAHAADRTQGHLRAVVALHGRGWLVVDRVLTTCQVAAEAWWHLHPDWTASLRGRAVALTHRSGRRMAFATTAAELHVVDDPALSSYAPLYGRVEHAVTVVAGHSASTSFSIATFFPAAASVHRIDVREVRSKSPRPGWVESAFDIESGNDAFQVSVAFPDDITAASDWPQPCITSTSAMRMT